ncbi:MAG TPA: ATP-binding cassette domain-containing protein, partial [Kofleriaceae bacterium]
MTALLEASGLSKSFRGLRAVAGASFDVPEGQISALIGPNGAGKTTVFNLIAGVHAPDAGTIHFRGRPIHGLRPDQICAAGIGRTFQLVKPFPALSVLDNVIVGALLVERSVAGARAAALATLGKVG